LDALISILKGEEELFDPSVLQAELTKAQSLVAKSKSYIGGLQSTIKGSRGNNCFSCRRNTK